MDKRIHGARLFGGDIGVEVEVFHLSGEVAGERRRIKMGDASDARLTGQNARPGFLGRVSNGGHTT